MDPCEREGRPGCEHVMKLGWGVMVGAARSQGLMLGRGGAEVQREGPTLGWIKSEQISRGAEST